MFSLSLRGSCNTYVRVRQESIMYYVPSGSDRYYSTKVKVSIRLFPGSPSLLDGMSGLRPRCDGKLGTGRSFVWGQSPKGGKRKAPGSLIHEGIAVLYKTLVALPSPRGDRVTS